MIKEVWKDVSFDKKYQISNLGNFKKGNKVINGWIQNTGYKTVQINNKKYSIHRLVAEAFIPNPENKPQVNHKDENKLNNHIENLEFCTRKYNCNYGTKMERQKEKLGKSVIQYDRNMTCINIYSSITKASQTTKINLGNIAKCCKNERKTAGGYIWKYTNKEII